MIFVDTSIWVSARRQPTRSDAAVLRELLDADEVGLALPVRLELLAGIARKDRRAFRRALSALPIAFPTDETWSLAESWVPRAADAGHRFSVPDLLIAALAAERGGLLWTRDAVFDAMEQLGFVQLYGRHSRR